MKYTFFHKLWGARKPYLALLLIVIAVTIWKQETFSLNRLLHNLYIFTLIFVGFESTEHIFDKLRLKYNWDSRYPIVNQIFKVRNDIWYFFHITLNYREAFLRKLNQKLGKWELCGHSPNLYLQLSFTHPVLVGDETGINTPIIPLNDPADVRYGYYYGGSTRDLPKSPLKLRKLWQKALSVYRSLPETTNYRDYCDHCTTEGRKYGASGIKGRGICPKCFGLAQIYHWGKQKEYGQKFIAGSTLVWAKNGYLEKVVFTPEGLKSLLFLYDRFTTGVVVDIVQEYLVTQAYNIIRTTFPNSPIYYTYSEQPEPGLCDFVYDGNNHRKIWYRRFYLLQEGKYINLYTGKVETPNNEIDLVIQEYLPNRDRWNVTIEILRNLCKFAK